MWLDGCSGCHMSFLDVDEGILTIAQKADLVYSPLVDIPEYPHDVDIAVVEGAVSSQEDVEKIRLVRERTRILVALGDCAITDQCDRDAQSDSAQGHLRARLCRRLGCGKRRSERRFAHAAETCGSASRRSEGRFARARLPPSAATILYCLNELLDGRIPDLATKLRFG